VQVAVLALRTREMVRSMAAMVARKMVWTFSCSFDPYSNTRLYTLYLDTKHDEFLAGKGWIANFAADVVYSLFARCRLDMLW
jgi:hypothetical protein